MYCLYQWRLFWTRSCKLRLLQQLTIARRVQYLLIHHHHSSLYAAKRLCRDAAATVRLHLSHSGKQLLRQRVVVISDGTADIPARTGTKTFVGTHRAPDDGSDYSESHCPPLGASDSLDHNSKPDTAPNSVPNSDPDTAAHDGQSHSHSHSRDDSPDTDTSSNRSAFACSHAVALRSAHGISE